MPPSHSDSDQGELSFDSVYRDSAKNGQDEGPGPGKRHIVLQCLRPHVTSGTACRGADNIDAPRISWYRDGSSAREMNLFGMRRRTQWGV